MKQEKVRLLEEKDGLEIHSRKLGEEASYAKELAAAAAVELRNLAEEVTKLSYQNAKLTGDLASARESPCKNCRQRPGAFDMRQSNNGAQTDVRLRKPGGGMSVDEFQKELNARCLRESSLETALSERDQIEGELRRRLNEAKQREEDLENELASMWVQIAKMRKSGTTLEETSSDGIHESNTLQSRARNGFPPVNGHSKTIFEGDKVCENMDEISTSEELRTRYLKEQRRCKELENLVSRLKVSTFWRSSRTSLHILKFYHCYEFKIFFFFFFKYMDLCPIIFINYLEYMLVKECLVHQNIRQNFRLTPLLLNHSD